jgi:hypothetical protein
MLEDAKRRLVKLEGFVPNDVVLELDDGTSLHYEGTALEFLTEAQQQGHAGGGPLFDAVMRSVPGRNPQLGRLHELMRAAWTPVLEARRMGKL